MTTNKSQTYNLSLLASSAGLILQAFTVRIHSEIARYPWARLWYQCRGLDFWGRGWIELPSKWFEQFLAVSNATIYRWLKDGKAVGAFRSYRLKNGHLRIYLGGLKKVCWHLNLRNWGDVGECLLWEIKSKIRALVTGIVGQSLQQKSRYAANIRLKPEYRKAFGAPHPNELLGDGRSSSLESAAGQVPFVLHISSSRVFVSKSFIHFGTSQDAISRKIGIHTRTVRRHQQKLGLVKRQICQAKSEYGRLKTVWDMEFSEYQIFNKGEPTHIGYKVYGQSVAFTDGIPLGAKKAQANEYFIPAVSFGQRFFKMGDQVWINRCNVYRESFTLTTMLAARREWKHQLSKWKHQLSQCQSQKTETEGG